MNMFPGILYIVDNIDNIMGAMSPLRKWGASSEILHKMQPYYVHHPVLHTWKLMVI